MALPHFVSIVGHQIPPPVYSTIADAGCPHCDLEIRPERASSHELGRMQAERLLHSTTFCVMYRIGRSNMYVWVHLSGRRSLSFLSQLFQYCTLS